MIFDLLKDKIPILSFLKKKICDDILIVASKDLQLFYFNITGMDFFQRCDGKKTLNDIKKEMLEEFDVSEFNLENDLVVLVRDLQWKRILTLKGVENNEKVL